MSRTVGSSARTDRVNHHLPACVQGADLLSDMSNQEQVSASSTATPEQEALPHVLVVDDDKRLRELLGRYLADQGFRVTTAINAAEARSKLSSVTFDLLVLDIMMPGETGLQLTEHLRVESSVPILLLTAMG